MDATSTISMILTGVTTIVIMLCIEVSILEKHVNELEKKNKEKEKYTYIVSREVDVYYDDKNGSVTIK